MMQRIPSPGKLEQNLMEAVTPQGALTIYNGFVDKLGAITKRPGLSFNQTLPVSEGIRALYYWPSKNKVVIVAGGKLWVANSLADAAVDVTHAGDELVDGHSRIVDTGRWLYVHSSSGHILQWNGEGEAVKVPDGVAPTNVSTMTTLNQRVVANEIGTNRFWFTKPPSLTDPEAPLEWDSFVAYGRNNESVVGLAVAGGELIVFKRDSMQAYYDDGSVTPYKPVIGSQKFYGLIGSAGFTNIENALFFISPDRNIYAIQDRGVKDVSTSNLWRALQKIRNAGDALMFTLDNKIFVTFEQENQTWVFDPVIVSWSQATSYVGGIDKAFVGRCATTLPAAGETNLWALGGADSKTYFWDASVFTDNGQPIRFLIRTPHLFWGTSNRKQSTRMVAKVSLEPLRLSQVPQIGLPEAYRCGVYYYELALPDGVSVTITGLPAGFNAIQTPGKLTVSGGVSDYAGTNTITITTVDSKGARYVETKSFVVHDAPDIDISGA